MSQPPRLAATIEVAQRVIDNAAGWYLDHPVPQAFARAHPLLLTHALRETDGDLHRCAVNPDGSIEIANHPLW